VEVEMTLFEIGRCMVEVEMTLSEIGRCMVEVGMTTFGIGLLDLRTRYQEVFGQRNAR
jgi:hypothetical protein